MTTHVTRVALARRLDPLTRPLRWPVESQLGSRRNALVAATALAESRRQHREVEEFLDRHTRPRPDLSARAASAGARQ